MSIYSNPVRPLPHEKKPRVGLANIAELLLSAGKAFPLVTIHREEVDPDVCWIGRVQGAFRCWK